MAFTEKAPAVWAKIKKGKFQVWNGTGNDEHDEITGRITSIRYRDQVPKEGQDFTQYREILLTISDSGGDINVSCPVDNSCGRAIQKLLPNLDTNEDVLFSLRLDKEFNTTSPFIKQSGGNLKYFWKNDDMKDLPGPEKYHNPKSKRPDKMDNDWTKQLEYLEVYIKANVCPLLKPLETVAVTSSPSYGEEPDPSNDCDGDDAPF
jgi:hypothetical protein